MNPYVTASDQLKNFVRGCIAGCTATTCIQPMDVIKVRIQLMSESGGNRSFTSVAKTIHSEGGFKAFYKG